MKKKIEPAPPTRDQDEPSYIVLESVAADAGTLGITLEHLLFMVKHSTRVTHEKGNRRYHGYVFDIHLSEVRGIARLDGIPIRPVVPVVDEVVGQYKCVSCKDTKKVKVWDVCPKCDGVGECDYCDNGVIPSLITCQDCSKSNKGVK